MKRYTHGKLSANEDISCHKLIEEWIREQQFLRYENSELQLNKKSRKRNKLYCFHSNHTDSNVVMKVSEISKDYKFWRRVNLYVTSLFKDYNYNAYAGSIKLLKAGIDTIRPIAYWTYKASRLNQKSYFLYEKIESGLNANELCNAIVAADAANKDELVDIIVDRCIAMVKKIHAAHIRHGDPHGGNILTSIYDHEINDIAAENIRHAKFTLIDNDRCTSSRVLTTTLKRFYDLKCLTRFNVCHISQQELLQRYLGKEYKTCWWYVLTFWRAGGAFSFRKRIYVMLKRPFIR